MNGQSNRFWNSSPASLAAAMGLSLEYRLGKHETAVQAPFQQKSDLLGSQVTRWVSDSCFRKTWMAKHAAITSSTGFAWISQAVAGYGLRVVNTQLYSFYDDLTFW